MQYFIQVFHYFMVLCCSSVAGLKSFQTSERRLLSGEIVLIEHVHELSMELARDIFDLSRTCWAR